MHAKIRARGERAIATLKTWKILTQLRCCPRRATAIVQAILVLHHAEIIRYAGRKGCVDRDKSDAPYQGSLQARSTHRASAIVKDEKAVYRSVKSLPIGPTSLIRMLDASDGC